MSLRKDFLSAFDTAIRAGIIDFGKRLYELSKQPNTVMVVMARKALCLYDCMEILGLTHSECPVVSDRVLDFNLNWLQDKKIVLVDDALISGTTLFLTVEKLCKIGIPRQNIQVNVLCVNKLWWSGELIIPDPPYLELSDHDTAALCATIIDAISILPRPYDADYPLFRDLRILDDDMSCIYSISGWESDDVTTSLQKNNSVFSVTITPKENMLVALDDDLGWDISSHSLVKIRLYGRLVSGKRKTWMCSLLPIAVLKPLPVPIINELFTSLVSTHPEWADIISASFSFPYLNDAQSSDTEILIKHRVISYIIAGRLAQIWLTQVHQETLHNTSIVLDAFNLSYLFPPNLIGAIKSIVYSDKQCFASASQISANTIMSDDQSTFNNTYISEEEIVDKLKSLFIDLYTNKEIPARQLALKYGIQVFNNDSWKSIINRLNIGYSFSQLCDKIRVLNPFIDVEKTVSIFLDKTIDRGCIVPITCCQDGHAYRAYRHGEDVEFGLEEERLCVLMLKKIQESYGERYIPRTIIEKSLVILIRIGLEKGFFNYWEGTLGDHHSMGIRYSLHGAVVSSGSEKIYYTSNNYSLVDIMKSHGYLNSGKDNNQWYVSSIPLSGFHSDRKRNAEQVGMLLGKLLGSDKVSANLIRQKDLVILATVLYPKDAVGALAAQINMASHDLILWKPRLDSLIPNTSDSTDLESIITQVQKSRFYFNANNGIWKYRKYCDREAWRVISNVSQLLLDPLYQSLWDSYWPSSGEQSDLAVHPRMKALLLREVMWLYNLKILTHMLLSAIQYEHDKRSNRIIAGSKAEKTYPHIAKLLETINEAKSEIEDQLTCSRYATRLIEGVEKGNLRMDGFMKYVKDSLSILQIDAKDILTEVDLLARSFGNPDNITYYNHVLHISFYSTSPDELLRITSQFKNVLIRFREQARRSSQKESKVSIDQIDSDQTPIKYGFWVCSSGYMSRELLIRFSLEILNTLQDNTRIKCVLFLNLQNNCKLRRAMKSSEYSGFNFWNMIIELKQLLFSELLNTSLLVVSDDTNNDCRSCVNKEISNNSQCKFGEERVKKVQLPNLSTELLIQEFATSESGVYNAKDNEKLGLTVGLITIVPDEIKAVRSILSNNPSFMKDKRFPASKRYCDLGTLPGYRGVIHNVICTRALTQGNQSIMNAYSDLVNNYQPDLVVLLGIGGSIHQDAKLCDVVIAESVWLYDKRAETERGSSHRGLSFNIEPWLINEMNRFFNDYGDRPLLKASVESCAEEFAVLLGPIGTGEAVIKHRDAEERKWLHSANDKVLAIDTEAAGVSYAFSENKLSYGVKTKGYLVLRGISDHADYEKSDLHRVAAAKNAMIFLSEFLGKLEVPHE
jgi:adenosylhomocysteine nucleosidase